MCTYNSSWKKNKFKGTHENNTSSPKSKQLKTYIFKNIVSIFTPMAAGIWSEPRHDKTNKISVRPAKT